MLNYAYEAWRPFLFLMFPCQWVGWRCTRNWGVTQLGQLTQTEKKISHNVWHCAQQQKLTEGRMKVETFGVIALSFLWKIVLIHCVLSMMINIISATQLNVAYEFERKERRRVQGSCIYTNYRIYIHTIK